MSVVKTQMKRSSADFVTAMQFSHNRMQQVGALVPQLTCPLMTVNYEEAVANPTQFVNEIISFLQLDAEDDARSRAIEMIDPKIGYRRLSSEHWDWTVHRAETFDPANLQPINLAPKVVNMRPVDGAMLPVDGQKAFFAFYGINRRRVHIAVNRKGDPAQVRLVVDVGNGFSGLMSEWPSLHEGKNIISIESPAIRAIRIFPEFDSGASNIGDVEIFGSAD